LRQYRWCALATLAVACLLVACDNDGAPAARTAPASATAVPASYTPPPARTPAITPTRSGTPPPGRTATATVPAEPARVVCRGNPDLRMVALTFDAGSDAGFTSQILETLRREGVRASFALTGTWTEENRDLALAIAAAGHRLINHTYDHRSFTGRSTSSAPLTAGERSLELSRTETTLYHLTGRTTRPYFRPPYADIDASVRLDAAADGYGTIVMWTVDTLGWQGASPDAIVQRSLANAAPGAIYVMHVGSESGDAAALPRIIDGLRAAGYSFGSLDDVLAP
jgi:peptidoglycan/xylan/chitin deacetylase (PgdA/CDA1 family)